MKSKSYLGVRGRNSTSQSKLQAKIIILASFLLLLATFAEAADFTQYIGSPTSNQINQISTYQEHAFGITTSNNILFYNGTAWVEISAPTHALGGALTQTMIDKATDGNFYLLLQNTTHHKEFWEYNPVTQTYTQIASSLAGTGTASGMACIHSGVGYDNSSTDADCYVGLTNGTMYGINGAAPSSTNPNGGISYLVGGTRILAKTATLKEYNGVSWNDLGVGAAIGAYHLDNNYKTTQFSINAYRWNQTTAAFTLIGAPAFASSVTSTAIEGDTLKIYAATVSNGIYKTSNYFSLLNFSLDTTTSAGMRSIDCDINSFNCWAGGDSGVIYHAGASGGSTTTVINRTTYTLTKYTHNQTGTTNIAGIAPLNEFTTYATALINGAAQLVSYDTSTATNIIQKNQTTGTTNTPRAISAYNDEIIIAESVGAYLFNNTAQGDATQASFVTEMLDPTLANWLSTIKYATQTTAYSCHTGSLQHGLIRYNTVSNTTASINLTENCYDIETDTLGTTIYTYSGMAGIKIYNASLSLKATKSIITSTPVGLITDALSAYGNNLAIVTGRNVIKIYDITATTSPNFLWECRTDRDITAIEMLSDKIIVAGTNSGISVCNEDDTALYDNTDNFYAAFYIGTIGKTPTDLARNNNNLMFSSAEGDQYTLYQLSAGDLSRTNLAPTITSIDTPSTTICTNESASFTIHATDQDTPLSDLRYYYKCNPTDQIFSTYTDFYCTFASIGTKTVTAGVTDGTTNVTKTKIIVVQNCSSNPVQLTIRVLDYDQPSQVLQDVLVNIAGYTSTTTDSNGYARITLASPGSYNLTLSKANYISQTIPVTLDSGSNFGTLYMKSNFVNDSNGNLIQRTLLIINVQDTSNIPIPLALVTYTDPITAIAHITSTDSNGQATFTDPPTGINLQISAGKTGYSPQFAETPTTQGQTTTVTIILLRVGESINQSSGRGCTDYVKGIILCSPLNTSGNGDSCTIDADCITGRCEPGLHRCSEFNWTQCDAMGLDRGGKCYTAVMAGAGGRGLTNNILDNLLYWLGATFILIFIIIIASILKRK
jgi:hypothetical protein